MRKFTIDGVTHLVPDTPRQAHGTPTNDLRGAWAGLAVELYAGIASSPDEPLEYHISDLLCDLAHHCDRSNISLSACLGRAKMHYEAECHGDDAEPDMPDGDLQEFSA